jgi:ribosome-binding protein aMBF1 (putative translation factor)
MAGRTRLELATFTRLLKFMFPDVLSPDHAVPIYKNSHPMNITFTISRYASETLGQFLKKLRLQRGLEQRELAKRLRVDKNSVCECERDRKGPSRRSMHKLAKFFKISVKTLESFRMKREKDF